MRDDARAHTKNRLVRRRSLLAWLIYAGLTLPIGLFGHVLFEQAGRVVGRYGSVELDHAVLGAAAAAAFAAALWSLRRGDRAERRRRAAMLQAALPNAVAVCVTGIAAQSAIAAATLSLEGVAVDPARVAVALVAAACGMLLASLLLYAVDEAVLSRIAAAAVLTRVRSCAGVTRAAATAPLARHLAARRRCSGRAPPRLSPASP